MLLIPMFYRKNNISPFVCCEFVTHVLFVYDYKFPTLAQKLYYHYKINQKAGKVPQGCKFKIIDFV